jgi:hypothetical protein
MDLEAARVELTRTARDATQGGEAKHRILSVQAVITRYGTEQLRLPQSPGLSFSDILRVAMEMPPGDARRDFALLLVHAVGTVESALARGETERLLQSFLERALLNPLRRAGYPFNGTAYDKRQALMALHTTIDEHLRPLEPTIPRWIHGLGAGEQA